MGMFSEAAKQHEEEKKAEVVNEKVAQQSWFAQKRYSILLYGPPKVGKTWAYCSAIEETLQQGKKVFVINTDAGLASTFRAYFGEKYAEHAKKLQYFFCTNTKAGILATEKILKEAQEGDLVIVDLISDFWSMAQDEFLLSVRMSPDEYIRLASTDPKKFGMYDSSKWNYIKYLDNLISDRLPKRGDYNIIGVTGMKDTDVEKKITGVANKDFQDIGFKPEGQKTLPHRFETLVLVGGRDEKFFRVVGNRGKVIGNKTIKYGRNFWQTLKELL